MQPDELKAIRTALGLTQEGFALAIGMSRKAVNEMERGGAIEPRTERAIRWVADGGHLPLRVSVSEMGEKYVVVVTERTDGVPGRHHRVLAPALPRDEAIAAAKALAEKSGCQFISSIA